MRRTIFFRYFIRSVILLMVSMLALSAAFVLGMSRILSVQQRARMNAAAHLVQSYMIPRIDPFLGTFIRLDELKSVLPLMANIGDINIIICDINGTVKLNSNEEPSLRTLPARVIALLNATEDVVSVPNSLMKEAVSDLSSTISVPLTIKSDTMTVVNGSSVVFGYLLVSSYQTGTRLLMGDFLRNWTAMSFIVVLLAGVTAYISARRQARPLRQMASCAHSFARGDFTARADTEEMQDGEIHDLAQAFNVMADAMERGEELRRGFIANVSHELKTPMTIISGFIGGILDGTVPEEKREETLTTVRDEVMRLSRLVESTASLSRLQTGQLELHPRAFDIAELSLRILLGFEGRVNDKGLSVDLDIPEPDTVFVYADPDSVTQVITNLLDNAVKFSTPGGTLGFTIRSFGGKARISVANEGPTVPPEDLPYIFDRFYKADRSRSNDRTGLGLGLFLVKSIINAHREDINVTSENDRTEFTFTMAEAKGR